VGNVARPVLPFDDRRSITCQACHEPHKKTIGRPSQPGPDPQLRAYGNVKFRNDAVAFGGEAAVCYTCHNSRTDTRANSPDMNVRRAPHDSTAAEMLSAANGQQFPGWAYTSSPHADRTRFIVAGRTEARQCLSCHNDVSPSKGQMGYNALGGHTFKMAQGDGTSTINNATFGAATTATGTRKFSLSAIPGAATLLKKVYTGDILVMTDGSDIGSFVVDSVDGARQITVQAAGPFIAFAGTVPPTSWSISSVPKYNVAACTQCHTTAADFRDVARGDYDGNTLVEPIQDEIAGLRAALKTAIEAKAATLVGTPLAPVPVTLTPASGRIKYTITAGSLVRTFPGPSVPSSENPEISYGTLSAADKASWDALYQAAYNWVYVGNDGSEGIHNTGYAVNLLQSAYKAVTGGNIGSPFIPF
jgi:predicted metal-binding protein